MGVPMEVERGDRGATALKGVRDPLALGLYPTVFLLLQAGLSS